MKHGLLAVKNKGNGERISRIVKFFDKRGKGRGANLETYWGTAWQIIWERPKGEVYVATFYADETAFERRS